MLGKGCLCAERGLNREGGNMQMTLCLEAALLLHLQLQRAGPWTCRVWLRLVPSSGFLPCMESCLGTSLPMTFNPRV